MEAHLPACVSCVFFYCCYFFSFVSVGAILRSRCQSVVLGPFPSVRACVLACNCSRSSRCRRWRRRRIMWPKKPCALLSFLSFVLSAPPSPPLLLLQGRAACWLASCCALYCRSLFCGACCSIRHSLNPNKAIWGRRHEGRHAPIGRSCYQVGVVPSKDFGWVLVLPLP